MSRFPGIEAFILATLEEQGEVRPPEARLAQEWFWQAASVLQARGLVVADQKAGVVRRPTDKPESGGIETEAPCGGLVLSRSGHERSNDLPARLRLLIRGWRSRPGTLAAPVYSQCALDLEEVLEESGKATDARAERSRIRRELLADVQSILDQEIRPDDTYYVGRRDERLYFAESMRRSLNRIVPAEQP